MRQTMIPNVPASFKKQVQQLNEQAKLIRAEHKPAGTGKAGDVKSLAPTMSEVIILD